MYITLRILLTALIFYISFPGETLAQVDVRESMVKIYCVDNKPDYDNPWNMLGPQSSSGSGCVIDSNQILTNAHVVSDHTFLQVRLYGQSKKYTAKVLSVSHEADLALIKVDDHSFYENVTPLKFGELPEVQDEVVVYGFPEGGDTLSTTTGVISRIEHQLYTHSLIELLAAQLDAAINSGNSGGPVLLDDRIVGVVMQSMEKSDNIGYMVPVPIIEHYLKDVEDGQYDGFPELGIGLQKLENETLKKIYNIRKEYSGALVKYIIPSTPFEGKILPGDIITSIDGHDIADDCTVEFRAKERTHLNYYIQNHQIGEKLSLTIFRNGKKEKIQISLGGSAINFGLVRRYRYDIRPSYFIYGGLVFCPLTYDYLKTWGSEWYADAPANLLHLADFGIPSVQNEEVVLIMKVLQSELNNGYQDCTDERILEVNGKKINNLRHLIGLIENEAIDQYVVFKTETGKAIGFNHEKVKKEQPIILKLYEISKDRSDDISNINAISRN